MKRKLPILLLLIVSLVGAGAAATLSVSEVDYVDTDSDFFDNDVVVAEYSLRGTGESIQATVDDQTLSNNAEADTDKSVTVSANLLDSYAEYGVQNRDDPRLHAIDYVRTSFDNEQDRTDYVSNSCIDYDDDGSNDAVEYTKGFFNTQYWVVCATVDKSEPIYNVGTLQSPPDSLFEAEWTVDVEGEPSESAVITNSGIQEGTSERIGDNVQVSFSGLRDLGSSAPNPQDTLAAYSSSEGWKLIEESEYEQYLDERQGTIPDKLEEYSTGQIEAEVTVEEWEENFKDYYDDASVVYDDSGISGATEQGNQGVSNGVFRYSSDSMFEWFVSDFSVKIDGEFVGLTKEFGVPRIQDVESTPDVTGLSGDSVAIDVKNVGSGQALFSPTLGSLDGFEVEGSPGSVSFAPGESKTIYATLNADGTESFTDQVSMTVEARESGNTDSTSFQASYEPAKECNPGTQDVIVNSQGNDEIIECASDGLSYNTLDTCSSSEHAELKSGDYQCVENDDPVDPPTTGECEVDLFTLGGTTYTIQNPLCILGNATSGVNFVVLLFDLTVSGIVGLFGFNIGMNYVSKLLTVSDATDKKALKLGVAVFLGLAAAIVFYSLFSSWLVKLLILIVLGVIAYFILPLISGTGVLAALGFDTITEG